MVVTSCGNRVSADTFEGQLLSIMALILGTVMNSLLIYGVIMSLKFAPQQEKVWILLNQVEQKELLKRECTKAL